jgi:DNA polymerase-1
MNRILIVDGNLLVHKSYVIHKALSVQFGGDRIMTGVPYGFVKSLIRLNRLYLPCQTCVVFDNSMNVTIRRHEGDDMLSNRQEIDPEYKADRKFDESMYGGVRLLYRFLRQMGLTIVYPSDRYEADDVIAYVEAEALRANMKIGRPSEVMIVSEDKDFHQLIKKIEGYQVRMHKKGDVIWDKKVFYRKFGHDPSGFMIYLALLGDRTDNIKGVRGYGTKRSRKVAASHDVDDIVKMLDPEQKEIFLKNISLISLNPLKSAVSVVHTRKFNRDMFNHLALKYKMTSFLKVEEQEILGRMKRVKILEGFSHDVVSPET